MEGIIVKYLLSCSMEQILLEKLIGSQPVKKLPAFYGTRSFITSFTSARHLSVSWATSIHSMPLHPIFLRSILILSSHLWLCLPSGLFSSGIPTKTLYIQITTTLKCPNSSVVEHKLLPGNAALTQAHKYWHGFGGQFAKVCQHRLLKYFITQWVAIMNRTERLSLSSLDWYFCPFGVREQI